MKFSLCNIFSTPQELSASERDLDVITEAERVASQEGGSDLIRVCGLSKVYKSAFSTAVNAVDRLSFGVGAGQCYGLLGTNGSGGEYCGRLPITLNGADYFIQARPRH